MNNQSIVASVLTAVVSQFAMIGIVLPTPPPTQAETAAPTSASTPRPANGAWGIDLTNIDKSVKPGDDFYRFVNGKWMDRVQIPADQSAVGAMNTMNDQALDRTRAILDDALADTQAAPGSETRKIADWYASLLDEAAIEKAGYAPIKPELDAISAVTTHAQLLDLSAAAYKGLSVSLLYIEPIDDRNVVKTMRPAVVIIPLSLGAREFYLDKDYAALRASQRTHIARVLELAGFSDAAARAKRVQDLETRIAQFTWSATEQRDEARQNNVITVAELSRRAPGMDWPKYLAAAGVGAPDKVILPQASAVAGMVKLAKTEPLESWKDYLRYMTLTGAASYLPKALRDEMFEFEGKQLKGLEQQEPRWKTALQDEAGEGRSLTASASERYVQRYIPADARPKAQAMIDNLVAAFDARLQKLEWMAPETRAGARAKLAKLTIKPLYPDVWNDVSALEVVRGEPVGNARRGNVFNRDLSLKRLKTYPDRRQFSQPVFDVNAYATPAWNEIVFLAAIMQPPAFDPAADDAVNYGAMGAIIGHEISHLFDDGGRKVDADGLLRDWWKPQDAARFNKVTAQLVKQVGAYEPLPGKKVNGALTLGENIADVAGLVVSHDAYKRSLKGKPAPVLDGYTGDQRFFMAYAQTWRKKMRAAAVEQLLLTDVHAPASVRPNTVRNLDAWYTAFDVKPGDKLYLKPEDRVQLW